MRTSHFVSAAACTLILAAALAAPARGQIIAPGSAPSSQAAPGPKVFDLTVSPAPQPEPALRYLLLPDVPDTTPGNAALLYHVATEIAPSRDEDNRREKLSSWYDLPLDKLPPEASPLVDEYRGPLQQVELAARRERCDWDLPIRSEGISMTIPPMGRYRDFARALSLRARLSISGGLYDDAIHDLQSGYAMARHVGDGSTLIGVLVGLSIASPMNQATLDLVQSKGGPNLYWALASLPRPFVDIRKAIDFERNWLLLGPGGPLLRKAAYGQPLSAEEAATLAAEMRKLWDLAFMCMDWRGPGEGQMRVQLPFTTAAIQIYPLAKKQLAQRGYTPEQIEKMPVAQAVAIYTLGRYFHWRDEMFKWHVLPWRQTARGRAKAEAGYSAAAHKPEEGWPFTSLLPGLSRAGFMAVRLDRQLGAMQAIEAVRLWAAAHGGQAPASLEELVDSPVPEDPVTGKAYQYERTDGGFVITCPAPADFSPPDGEVYRVTFRK